jgi:dihydrolipoamide dehydrogenase
MEKHYDLAVIGSGPGGYVAAVRAAQLGLKTVCIDKRSTAGGTCLNVGCIPSKALLQSTEFYAHLRNQGQEHGIEWEHLSVHFSQMMKRKEKVVQGLVDSVAALFKHHHIDFINGVARFLDSHTIEIQQAHNRESIRADYVVLATGSEPTPLSSLPFDERQIVSSTGALSLSAVPDRMMVIGGGVIGVELASVYQRLGTQVTIIEMLDTICSNMDLTLQKQLLQVLQKQGISFLLSTQFLSAVVQPDEIIVTINQQQKKLVNLSVDVVLVAVGRRPYHAGLDLDKIGIRTHPKGYVVVDHCFRATHSHIFAIGDLIEGVMLAHRASIEGYTVAEMIAGHQATPIHYMTIPNVVYTSPEAASVGMSEAEAREANLSIQVGMSHFKGNPRARCTGDKEGFVKVIGEKESGRIIGMHILGPYASELIGEGMMALLKKSTLQDWAHAPNAHPTYSEAIKEAALIALGRPIHA